VCTQTIRRKSITDGKQQNQGHKTSAHYTPDIMDIPTNENKLAERRDPHPLPPSDSEIAPRKAAQTAAQVVLSTAELVSNIIYRLPFTDMVTTTGVCHFWRNAIAADQRIQKALSFSPEEVTRVLVFRRLWSLESEHFFQSQPGDIIPKKWCYTIGDLHPFIHKICGLVNTYMGLPASAFESDVKSGELLLGFAHPHGCWRNMLISQPPCECVEITLTTEWIWPHTSLETHKLLCKDKSGVRLGVLHDFIRRNLAKGESN
jgi:hypothetical protein